MVSVVIYLYKYMYLKYTVALCNYETFTMHLFHIDCLKRIYRPEMFLFSTCNKTAPGHRTGLDNEY